ncbi:MAG: phytoene desaturase family protein [Candidatus Thalassarchaeaceae archaeon]|nr:phytoene desaturase family protein [Candidatus Thalassarchaeaceae archaeon]
MSDSETNVLIVGAGPGGLASALLLAKAGLNVQIIEKSNKVGGRTKLFTKDGYTFDTGPTFFHYPEVVEEIFQAIGLDAHNELDLIRLDPNYRLIFGQGGCIDATTDVEHMVEQIRELCGEKDAEGFRRYIRDNRRKLEMSKKCLNTPWKSVWDIFSKRAFRVSRVLRPWRSVASDLSKSFKDERMQLAMSFQTKYLGMSPFHAPSLFTILAYLEYEYGIFHPKGGLGKITEKMAEIALEMGVEIRLSEAVEELLFENKKVVGVRTPKGNYKSDCVVMNADFASGMKALVPDKMRKKWSNKKLEKKSYSCSTFMLYLGLDNKYDTPHHQIYASSEYQNNLEDIVKHRVTWDDPSFYVQNACITDPELAPKGCSTLYILVPVTHMHESVDWDEIKVKFRDLIISQLPKLGFEDVKEHIVSETIVTPDDWGNRDVYKGAVFNLAHGLDQMLWKRPQNRFEEFEGLYLVGGGTHPGSGLPTILESGRISSKLICADMGINPDWNGMETWFDEIRKPKFK